jgi:hypothetical protein
MMGGSVLHSGRPGILFRDVFCAETFLEPEQIYRGCDQKRKNFL